MFWTPETFGVVAGIVLTLLFTFAPKLNVWFAAKAEAEKQQWMAVLLLLIAAAGTALSCTGLMVVIVCTKDGIVAFFLYTLVPAIISNQSVDRLIPKPKSVIMAKEAGKLSRGEVPPTSSVTG
jgi:hypothetical protein